MHLPSTKLLIIIIIYYRGSIVGFWESARSLWVQIPAERVTSDSLRCLWALVSCFVKWRWEQYHWHRAFGMSLWDNAHNKNEAEMEKVLFKYMDSLSRLGILEIDKADRALKQSTNTHSVTPRSLEASSLVLPPPGRTQWLLPDSPQAHLICAWAWAACMGECAALCPLLDLVNGATIFPFSIWDTPVCT